MEKNKLHTIKSTGFKTPDAYFDAFETDFFERLNEKTPISGIENTGFTVPKAYFDTIEPNVLNHLNTEPETPVISLIKKRTLYYVAGFAASFVLLFSLVFNANKSVTIDKVDTSSIEYYLFQEEYSNDDLASLFTDTEISETDFIDITVSDETLNQYLEEIDTEDLLIE